MRRSHPVDEKARHSSAWSWIARSAALLAILLQAFVVQAHAHGFAHSAVAAYERAADHLTPVLEGRAQDDRRAPCAFCQTQANSRALLTSDEATAALSGRAFVEGYCEIRRIAAPPAHFWQSRAPPASF